MVLTDRIEREIMIQAPLARVWALVSEPGWWVGDGDRSGQMRHRAGGLQMIEDPRYGRFPVRTEAVEPHRYVAFRRASTFPGQDLRPGNSTLVEFWLSERGEGSLVRVVESGFAALAAPDAVRRRSAENNEQGWRQQLAILESAASRDPV